ncbi:hypothetical protein SNE40_005674 [Patella caerulea]|uniref:Uncharacterized protein n=1 Tax=Patella caerulea TaxID=87958 RepID=A0AAN8QBY9_PATCE
MTCYVDDGTKSFSIGDLSDDGNNLDELGIRLTDIIDCISESYPIRMDQSGEDKNDMGKTNICNFLPTTEDIITDHIAQCDNQSCSRELNCRLLLAENTKNPNMSLGIPNKLRQRRHTELEGDYWKLKLDLLGLRNVIKKPVKESQTSNEINIFAIADYITPTPTPDLSEDVRSVDHFQQYLGNLQQKAGTCSAPPEGRDKVVDVRTKQPKKPVTFSLHVAEINI